MRLKSHRSACGGAGEPGQGFRGRSPRAAASLGLRGEAPVCSKRSETKKTTTPQAIL